VNTGPEQENKQKKVRIKKGKCKTEGGRERKI
jgi:hypothetical protein